MGNQIDPKGAIKDVFTDSFERIIEYSQWLFTELIGRYLELPPARIDDLQPIWDTALLGYGLILGIGALASLGMIQFFPGAKKVDPERFTRRAVVATISLFIVNPPGTGTLFSRGVFAWTMTITNQMQRLYLSPADVTVSFSVEGVQASTGPFVMAILGYLFGSILLLGVFILLLFLVMRHLAVFIVFGLYPILIAFWVYDVGPMKYGRAVSTKMFKAATQLLVGGIFVAAILKIGLALIVSGVFFADGSATAASGAPIASGVLATNTTNAVLLQFLTKSLIIMAICVLPTLMLKQMLDGLGLVDALKKTAGAGVKAVELTAEVTIGAVAAVATSGTSSVISLAGSGVKSVAKQGVKQTASTVGKQVVKKGMKKTVGKGVKETAGKGIKKAASETVKRGTNTAVGTVRSFAGGDGGSELNANTVPEDQLQNVSTTNNEE